MLTATNRSNIKISREIELKRFSEKTSKFIKNQIIDYDYVILNSSNILHYMDATLRDNKSINMFVYIHHPGQLIKEFGKQILELKPEDFRKAMEGATKGLSKDNFRDIHLSHVEVLRKRSDGFMITYMVIFCHRATLKMGQGYMKDMGHATK